MASSRVPAHTQSEMASVSSSVTDVNAMVATIVKIAAGRSRPTALAIPPGEPASTARITAAIEVSSSITPPIPRAISNGDDPDPENQLAPGVGLVEVSITDQTASISAKHARQHPAGDRGDHRVDRPAGDAGEHAGDGAEDVPMIGRPITPPPARRSARR